MIVAIVLGAGASRRLGRPKQTLPLGEFILGNRKTRRRPDQLLAAILVPKSSPPRAASHFMKLGSRRYLIGNT